MTHFNGYYRASNEGHGRYYGVISKNSPEEAFIFLYKECLEILKSPKNITECYVEHVGEISPTSKGHKFRTNHGFSDGCDMFEKEWEYFTCKYIHLKRPKLNDLK